MRAFYSYAGLVNFHENLLLSQLVQMEVTASRQFRALTSSVKVPCRTKARYLW